MATTQGVIVTCDGMNCDCRPFASTGTSAAEARKKAADHGWTHNPKNNTDWGPAHRRFIKEG